MLKISPYANQIHFLGNKTKKTEPQKEVTNDLISTPTPKIILPTVLFLSTLNILTTNAQTTLKDPKITHDNIENIYYTNQSYPTQLDLSELLNAPSPEIKIAGKKKLASIVVDVNQNKLYRYDKDGNIIDAYMVATGKRRKNGTTMTNTGIRMIDHKESYPYSNAHGTKRIKNPKDYGPKLLYLTIVNPETGETEGSDGRFIHGNNNPDSIGHNASHGCIRMDNEVITKIVEEAEIGSYVLIK